jgi:hypothetical protein
VGKMNRPLWKHSWLDRMAFRAPYSEMVTSYQSGAVEVGISCVSR